jgi:hypothetical protein
MTMAEPNWEGRPNRTCGEHRTCGRRAWCFDCHEWCSAMVPCIRCEEPELRARIEKLEVIATKVVDTISDPWYEDGNGNPLCAFCESGFQSFDMRDLPPEHADDCAWVLAHQYVAEIRGGSAREADDDAATD